MKRIICLITALCLIFGSFSFCFATDISWNTTDSGHLTEIRNALMSGGTIYNLINSCTTQLNNINYNLVTLMGWLDPSTGGSTTALLNKILSVISYTDAGGALKSWLADIWQLNAANLPYIFNIYSLLNANRTFYAASHGIDGTITASPFTSDFLTVTVHGLASIQGELAGDYAYIYQWLANGYNSQQTYTNPLTLQTANFSPTSISNGIYTWLSKIQEPTARLSYVLASPERIAAQEAAADNEEAVVDNFIDSTGDGSASPSDIGSISDLSSGYKSNFGSDASVSGIFNIFNSNNMGWFSQETANQLDTTTPNRRGSSFDTPLLDQQINDIYDQIGVVND